jgi:hypothetical protein
MSNRPIWTIDGVPFPRNPDNWTAKFDPANVSYVTMADGTVRRIVVPFKFKSVPVEFDFTFADQRVRNFVLQQLNNDILHKITVDGEYPAKQVWCYLDTPDIAMSKGIFDSRVGQGGMRRDLKITGRTDGPFWHSVTAVPSTVPTAAQMQQWFGGPFGSPWLDYIPKWGGNAYNIALPVNAASTFSNVGTAPWSPTIRITGPFNTGLQIKAAYQDVDGTGQGVVLTYLGPNVAAGNYLLFDTQKCRMYSVIGGAQNEIYTFSLTTVAAGTPFPFWPPLPMGDFTLTTASVAGTTGSSGLDLSNNGSETFRYWP